MKIYLIRHGKSDKSLKNKLSHEVFEQSRPLVPEAHQKAIDLGKKLRSEIKNLDKIILIHSGKLRSKQTLINIAEGLELSEKYVSSHTSNDTRLTYKAEENYWEQAKLEIMDNKISSYAEYFLNNPSDNDSLTYSPIFIRNNMIKLLKGIVKQSSDENIYILVSHEPVISLLLTELTKQNIDEIGGEYKELEYVIIEINNSLTTIKIKGLINYRMKIPILL